MPAGFTSLCGPGGASFRQKKKHATYRRFNVLRVSVLLSLRLNDNFNITKPGFLLATIKKKKTIEFQFNNV